MSRYVKEYTLRGASDELGAYTEKFFMARGYKLKNVNSETVYHKGNGWIAPPKYVKFSIVGTTFRIESWIKYSILPHVAAGELDISDGSFLGCIPKSQVKAEVFDYEQQIITRGWVSSEGGFAAAAQAPSGVCTCPHCSRQTQIGTFCEMCGARLSQAPTPAPVSDNTCVCPHCSQQTQKGAFCSLCGGKITN